jgi:hypothetical protein
MPDGRSKDSPKEATGPTKLLAYFSVYTLAETNALKRTKEKKKDGLKENRNEPDRTQQI